MHLQTATPMRPGCLPDASRLTPHALTLPPSRPQVRHTHATERVMQEVKAKDKAKAEDRHQMPPPVATHSAAAGGGAISASGAVGYTHQARHPSATPLSCTP